MKYYHNTFNVIEKSPTIQYHDKNQNAISHHHSHNENISTSNPKEDQQLLNPSLPSTNFTTDNPVELRININNKPSRKKKRKRNKLFSLLF